MKVLQKKILTKSYFYKIKTEVKLLGPLPIKRQVHIQKADNKDDKGSSYVATLYKIPDQLGANLTKVTKAKMTTTNSTTKQKYPKINRSSK